MTNRMVDVRSATKLIAGMPVLWSTRLREHELVSESGTSKTGIPGKENRVPKP